MRHPSRSTIAAVAAAISSFGVTHAVYAYATKAPLWPQTCAACAVYGPNQNQDPVACRQCCNDDPDCINKSGCTTCCDAYNGGDPTGPQHCREY